MLLRTHLAFAVLMIILFIEHVNNKLVFVSLVLVATVLPDLDSPFSSWGRHLIFRPLQVFVKHRGIIHSFTFGIAASVALAIFWPVAALGFFAGYSIHLICDSFTKDGIQPFWPLRSRSSGFITSGGRVEDSLFLAIVLIDILVVVLVWIF